MNLLIIGPHLMVILDVDNNTECYVSTGHLPEGVYTYSVVVCDLFNECGSAEHTLIVTEPNETPIVNAGEDLALDLDVDCLPNDGLYPIMLNGSGYDAEDDVIISYTWFDNSDDSIVCSNTANEQDCIIDKPEGEHCFTYENTDIYGAQGTDVVCYYVREYDLNTDPISDAGSDQCVDEGSPIILDGCNSHDLEDCNLEYKWFKGDTIISNECTAIDVAQNVDENSPEFNIYISSH